MTRDWRLVFGNELYDIKSDPGQQNDVADNHPEVVEKLRTEHTEWYDRMAEHFQKLCPLALGNDAENPTTLCAMDVMGDVAWNQQHILMAQKSTGRWTVEVEQPGTYTFALRRWPPERDLKISDVPPQSEAEQIAPYNGDSVVPVDIHPAKAQLVLFGKEHVVPVGADATRVTFQLDIDETGETQLEAWFFDDAGERRGAYYVDIERH